MMTNSHSPEYRHQRRREDLDALLLALDVRRAIIRRLAWRGATWEAFDSIFDEATAMRAYIEQLLNQHQEEQ